MDPEYPRLTNPKKHILYESGISSLKSWYEEGVESQGFKSLRYDTNEHFRGNLEMFPQLDVMPGEASAVNDGVVHNWGISNIPPKNIDVAVLNFEEMLGGLHGYRIHNNTGFDDDVVNQYKQSSGDDLFMLDGLNIDMHSAQEPHGRHEIDSAVQELSAQVASQHNVGDSLEGRDAGLERADNPALNAQETGKGEAFENQDTVDTNVPTTVPMDIDAIEIDGVVTKPMDTNIALGANQTG
jgi:hypothetical protein